MKANLKDVTFLMTIRLDSMIRLENLLMTTQFLVDRFNCRIVVLESDVYNNGMLERLLNHKISYVFAEDHDPVFYRTKYINLMAQEVDTEYLSIWDADVIAPKKQISEAVDALRRDLCDVAWPYDGRCYDTSDIIREYFYENRNLRVLSRNVGKMNLLYGNNIKGGAIFVNTKKYIEAGLDNEKIYGWGPEDYERYERWKNLGFRFFRAPGYLFHFTHPRGGNSKYRSMQQLRSTNQTLFTTKMSSEEEIHSSLSAGQ